MKHWQVIRMIFFIVLTAAVVAGMSDAAAQRGRGGPGLSPEEAEKAWTLEAQSVAAELKLSKEVSEKLVAAYKSARKSHGEATAKLAGQQTGDRQAQFQAYRELRETESGKLEEALKGIVKEDQVSPAMASLGTFDRRWDHYVDSLAGYELGDEKLTKALRLVNQFVAESAKAMREAFAGGDRESVRQKRQELKEKLDTDLATVLSEEQQAKWKEATAFRGRGR